MSAAREPPVPADADLKDFPFTPIYRARLFGSTFHARANDAEWRAGVTLWLKAQDQKPAGSLPDDDVDLCRLAELGRDLKAWRKIKDGALRGWFKASDGRLYHDVVAEVVNEQWGGKQRQRDRTRKAREERERQRLSQSGAEPPTDHVTDPVTSSVTETVTASKRKGEGQGKRESNERSGTEPDAVRAVVRSFMALRDRFWPDTSALPSPSSTLETQAKQYLDAGASAELCAEVFERVMMAKLGKLEGAPTNLGFCRLTIESEIRKIGGVAPRNGNGADHGEALRYAVVMDRWAELGTPAPAPKLEEHPGLASEHPHDLDGRAAAARLWPAAAGARWRSGGEAA